MSVHPGVILLKTFVGFVKLLTSYAGLLYNCWYLVNLEETICFLMGLFFCFLSNAITFTYNLYKQLTHCGRVTQICVFNTVKLGTSACSP